MSDLRVESGSCFWKEGKGGLLNMLFPVVKWPFVFLNGRSHIDLLKTIFLKSLKRTRRYTFWKMTFISFFFSRRQTVMQIGLKVSSLLLHNSCGPYGGNLQKNKYTQRSSKWAETDSLLFSQLIGTCHKMTPGCSRQSPTQVLKVTFLPLHLKIVEIFPIPYHILLFYFVTHNLLLHRRGKRGP